MFFLFRLYELRWYLGVIFFLIFHFSVEQKKNDPNWKMFLFQCLDRYDKIQKTIPEMKVALRVKIFNRKI